jgi:hypothetical protein
MAVDKQGRPLTAVVEDPLNPGESAARQAPRRLAQAPKSNSDASAESSQLRRLAADYASWVIGLGGEDMEHLRQRGIGSSAPQLQAFQLKLRDLGNFPACLHHALERVQGHDYEPAETGGRANILNNAPDVHNVPAPPGYAGAPPADEALRWLRSKAPASARCGGLP